MLIAGQPAPAFSLFDADMESFEFSSVLGKHHLVLYFYPRDDTPGCTLQAINFTDHEKDFAGLNSIVVGVSPDDCLKHADFRDKHGLSIRLLSDPDRDVCRLYDVWQEREVDGIRRMGVVRSTFVIDDKGIVRHALYNVQPRGHAMEVLELVRAIDKERATKGKHHAGSEKHRRHVEVPGDGS